MGADYRRGAQAAKTAIRDRLTVVRKWITGGPVVREEQRRHRGRPDYWMRQRRVRRPLIIIWLSVTRLSLRLQLCRVAVLQPNYR